MLAFVRVATQCLFVGQFSLFSEEGLTDFSLNYQLLKRFCSYQWIQTAVLRGAERQCREPGLGGSTDGSLESVFSSSPKQNQSRRAFTVLEDINTDLRAPYWSSVSREILRGLAAASYFHSRRTPVQTCC